MERDIQRFVKEGPFVPSHKVNRVVVKKQKIWFESKNCHH